MLWRYLVWSALLLVNFTTALPMVPDDARAVLVVVSTLCSALFGMFCWIGEK